MSAKEATPHRPLRVIRVLETCIHAKNVPNAADFYENLFGFRRMVSNERMCVFDVGGVSVLIIFQAGGTREPLTIAGGVIPPHGGSGDLHFALAIAAEDLSRWEERLLQQGVAIESRVRWEPGGESLYFRDLDGHLVELATPGIWPTY